MYESQPFFEVFNHSTCEKFYRIEGVPTPSSKKCTVITPAHYGHTIEIIMSRNISGTAVINGNQYEIQPKNVFLYHRRWYTRFAMSAAEILYVCAKSTSTQCHNILD